MPRSATSCGAASSSRWRSGVEVLDAASDGAHGGAGAALLDGPVGVVTELRAGLDLGRSPQRAELGAELLVGGDDQRLEFVDCPGPSANCCGPGHGVDTDRFADPVVSSGHAQPITTECLAGGADGVQGVGLRCVLALAGRAVELDDPFAAPAQRRGEAAAVTGRPFDDPRPVRVDAVSVDEVDSVVVAVAGRCEATFRNDP
jgi:hypothetical protein